MTVLAAGINERNWPARSAARLWLPIRRDIAYAVLWLAMGAAAAYFLVPQLGSLVESVEALRHIQPLWLLAAAGFVAARYGLAALSLRAAVGRPIPFWPTALVQVSTSFVGRLTPEGVGWLVLNQRFLEKSGLTRVMAASAIALRMVAGGAVRVAIVVIVAVLVGGDAFAAADLPLDWPILVAAAGAVVTAIAAGAYLLRPFPRLTASLAEAVAHLVDVFRSPWRAAALIGGSAAITVSYVLALFFSVAAVDADVAFTELFAMYLAATAVASASPTPGNLGALEVALGAGLATLGVDMPAAIAGVLVFRLLTFWLPLIPGFIAFRYLQKRGHL